MDAAISPLSRVKGLSPKMVEGLERANIRNPADILMSSDAILMHALNISLYAAREIMRAVAEHVAPVPVTAAALADSTRLRPWLPFPLPTLNTLLLGGLPPSILEITGAAGAGKTQFAMTCAANAAAIGAGQSPRLTVLYIDTEGAVNAKRFQQILKPHCLKAAVGTGIGTVEMQQDKLSTTLSAIRMHPVHTVEELTSLLEHLEDYILSNNVHCIVLDSIASLVRAHFVHGEKSEAIARSDLLARTASALKRIADTFKIPIIVTNQITTQATEGGGGFEGDDSISTAAVQAELAPALGPTWAHAVNTRLFLKRTYERSAGGTVTIMKSPIAPHAIAMYRITEDGMGEVEAEYMP